jgi:hypothetical protein
MKNLLIKSQAAVLLAILSGSCTEVKDWQDPKDSVPPGTVSNVTVENLNGGARITYSLPDDDDLLGVKAVYSFGAPDKETREAFSSAFRDTIELEGYADTIEHAVSLFTIDKSRNESSPVQVKIQPLIPPVEVIKRSLKANATFGGLYVTWDNPFKAEVAISLYTNDSIGDRALRETYYTQAAEGKYAFRGFESMEQDFHIEIRDRWNNYSTPFDTTAKPLFEEQIMGRSNQAGNIWQRYGWADQTCLYRGDVYYQRSGAANAFEVIFDGIEFNANNWWHTDYPNRLIQFIPDWPDREYFVLPVYFTIDMGRMASYSRFRFWMRNRSPLFSAPIFDIFEVWGTNHPKPVGEIGDGSREANLKYWTEWPETGGTDEWKNDWVQLSNCILTLPSGETDPNKLTGEDQEFIRAGFEFEIDPQYSDTPLRYIRFVLRRNTDLGAQIQLSELKFWGAYAD